MHLDTAPLASQPSTWSTLTFHQVSNDEDGAGCRGRLYVSAGMARTFLRWTSCRVVTLGDLGTATVLETQDRPGKKIGFSQRWHRTRSQEIWLTYCRNLDRFTRAQRDFDLWKLELMVWNEDPDQRDFYKEGKSGEFKVSEMRSE